MPYSNINHPTIEANQPPSLKDFWEARGRTGFWVTTVMGYTIGCVIASLAYRCRVSPNLATIFGFFTAVIAVLPIAVGSFSERWVEGLWLGIFLLLSYGWDCADGILSRVTGKGSSFGMIWDKLVDLLSFYAVTAALCCMAKDTPPAISGIQENWHAVRPILMLWSLMPKSLFSVFCWLKDQQINGMSRSQPASKTLSLADRIRRFAGNLIDEPVFRVGLAAAWAFGFFWEYVIIFQGIYAFIFVAYVADSWRKLSKAQ